MARRTRSPRGLSLTPYADRPAKHRAPKPTPERPPDEVLAKSRTKRLAWTPSVHEYDEAQRQELASVRPSALAKDVLRAVVEYSFRHLTRLTTGFPSSNSYKDAIRRKCIDCCAGSTSEIAGCQVVECPLWPYRMRESRNRIFGKQPGRTPMPDSIRAHLNPDAADDDDDTDEQEG